MEKPLVSLNETIVLKYTNIEEVKFFNGRISFEPSRIFETEFDVKAGEGEKLIQDFQDRGKPVYLECYSPSGSQIQLKLIGLEMTNRGRINPVDTLRAAVDLTLEQLWIFSPAFYSPEFGY